MTMKHVTEVTREDYPWSVQAQEYLTALSSTEESVSSGWDRQRKLALLEGLVNAYKRHQDQHGAVIDPYSDQERYYSTPCYALAAAVLVNEGRTELLESAASALESSIQSVVTRTAPDEHPDFFPVMIMGAYRLLKTRLPERAVHWHEQLQQIQPEEYYRFTMSHMKNPNRMINWNAIMISGEYVRYLEGMASEAGWMDTYLRNYHLPRFTALGLYQDGPLNLPNSPFSYDAATRYHLGTMLRAGYHGECLGELEKHLARGAFSSLLMLSPQGMIPPRGRSGQHQWNEAAAAFTFTTSAQAAYEAGDVALAGAFRRAAALCWDAIGRWVTPEGNLRIVRNYYEPEARHGFEVYSNHTCYNLWTTAALAYTILHDGVDVPERPIPAELGSRVLVGDGWFQTILAAVPGQQMVIQTSLNDPYHIPGIVRIQHQQLPELIGPAAPGHKDSGFTEYGEGEILPISYAPAWRTLDGQWHSLAEGLEGSSPFDRDVGIDPADGGGAVQVKHEAAGEQFSELELSWSGPFKGVSEVLTRYKQEPGRITVTYEINGEVDTIGAIIPLMHFDGQEHSHIRLEGQTITNEFRGVAVTVTSDTPHAVIELQEETVACRNGLLKWARIEASGREISFQIVLAENATS